MEARGIHGTPDLGKGLVKIMRVTGVLFFLYAAIMKSCIQCNISG